MPSKCYKDSKNTILMFSLFLFNPILHGLFWAGLSRGDRIQHTFITFVLFDEFELKLVE